MAYYYKKLNSHELNILKIFENLLIADISYLIIQYSPQTILCPRCNVLMNNIGIVDDYTLSLGHNIRDEYEDDGADNTFLCFSCKNIYAMKCYKCKNFMQFLGHDLMCDHPIDNPRKCKICKIRSDIFYTKKGKKLSVEASYIKLNTNFVDLERIVNGSKNSITGDDGGFLHYWYCETCDKIRKFTDK
jgi:hypothetical protein